MSGANDELPGPGLPVVLTVAGRTVLVVGGGPVGRRKAAAARAAGASVRLVALEAGPPRFRRRPGRRVAWPGRTTAGT